MIDEMKIEEALEFLTNPEDEPIVEIIEDDLTQRRRKFLASLETSECCRGEDAESCKCK